MTKHMRLELPDETYAHLGALANLKHRDKKSQVMALIDEAISDAFPTYRINREIESIEKDVLAK